MRSKAERSYPRRLLLALAGSAVLVVGASGCQTTPVTGKRTLNIFTPSQDVELGREAYAEATAGEREVTSGPELELVRRVMSRLVAVSDDPGYEWEVKLLDNDEVVNAFALPGGKMAVYTGILPVCGGEAGLAVVMGHEIGHVVAQHGTQRVTRSMGAEAVLAFLNLGDYQGLAEGAYGLLVDMPWGRADESEADHIGLIYMARAGYDPRTAVEFWSRMAEGTGGGPPELLSTHPSDETRIADLNSLMPEAVKVYESSKAGH